MSSCAFTLQSCLGNAASQQQQEQWREKEKTRDVTEREENEGERGQGAEMKGEYLRSEESLSYLVKCEEIVAT